VGARDRASPPADGAGLDHSPTTSLYYTDPDGHGVAFFVDNFDSVETLKGWMQSDAFRANPIGVTFDPERLVARDEAGDPIDDLLEQGSA